MVHRLRTALYFTISGPFLGLAEWRNAGGGVGREQRSLRLARGFATLFRFALISWSEEKEETARSLHGTKSQI